MFASAGAAEQRAEHRGRAERGQQTGGHGELVAIGRAVVRRVQGAGCVHEPVELVVRRRDPLGEVADGTGVDDVEDDRFDGRAAREVTGLPRVPPRCGARSRPTSHKVACNCANPSATARPIPDEAPVTTTTRPARLAGGRQSSNLERTA